MRTSAVPGDARLSRFAPTWAPLSTTERCARTWPPGSLSPVTPTRLPSPTRSTLPWIALPASSDAGVAGTASSPEACNEPALPGRLHRPRVVVPAHIRQGICGRYTVEDGQAGQRRSGAASSSGAGHLDSLGRGPLPQIDESLPRLNRISGEPPVRPPQPP